ncbi:hypothetical protein LEP3755_39130 [Leptolyngbya sp. NIES-3755]|nr:hypothetical protein LEP3755_39130 [Leptolyngbya sp. NIES-3755]
MDLLSHPASRFSGYETAFCDETALSHKISPELKMKLSTRPNTHPIPNSPVWKSPLILFTLGFLFVLISSSLFFKPQAVTSTLYVDVSTSNQPFKAEVITLCRQRLTFLKPKDAIVDAQFADRITQWQNTTYQPQAQNNLRSRCDRILDPDASLGHAPGTALMSAVRDWSTQVQHVQLQNQAPVVAIFVIQAAEVADGQTAIDWQQIKHWIQERIAQRGVVLIVGSEATLQSQWITAFKESPRTQIVPYRDSDSGLKWAFDLARKS